jgi:hypothetical protein
MASKSFNNQRGLWFGGKEVLAMRKEILKKRGEADAKAKAKAKTKKE